MIKAAPYRVHSSASRSFNKTSDADLKRPLLNKHNTSRTLLSNELSTRSAHVKNISADIALERIQNETSLSHKKRDAFVSLIGETYWLSMRAAARQYRANPGVLDAAARKADQVYLHNRQNGRINRSIGYFRALAKTTEVICSFGGSLINKSTGELTKVHKKKILQNIQQAQSTSHLTYRLQQTLGTMSGLNQQIVESLLVSAITDREG